MKFRLLQSLDDEFTIETAIKDIYRNQVKEYIVNFRSYKEKWKVFTK